ncbi:MAG: HAD family hydrolase [Fibrobacterota bacterium]|nr:MAG: HAD family hydrolase [Fibrobacterota bacterium]
MNRALFLDRDGVVNVEKNYVHRIEDFQFMDGIFDLCRSFRDRGYLLVIVTNQAGLARGFYTQAQFHALSDWMRGRFAEEGLVVSGIYHCPHHPSITGDCLCRKPHPGMLLDAASDLDLDLPNCVLVGDKDSDLEAGRRAGLSHLGLVHGTTRLETVEFGSFGCIPVFEMAEIVSRQDSNRQSLT